MIESYLGLGMKGVVEYKFLDHLELMVPALQLFSEQLNFNEGHWVPEDDTVRGGAFTKTGINSSLNEGGNLAIWTRRKRSAEVGGWSRLWTLVRMAP